MDAWRRWFLIAWAGAGTVLAVALAVTLHRPLRTSPEAAPPQTLQVPGPAGSLAPDFRLRSFAGSIIALTDFRGQVVVLNFWASWCAPCRAEMPILERVWREFRSRSVAVVGVDVADEYDEAALFLKQMQITYPNVYDPEQTRMQTYRITGLPSSVFLDPQRRIRGQVAGGYLPGSGYTQLRGQIFALLSAPR